MRSLPSLAFLVLALGTIVTASGQTAVEKLESRLKKAAAATTAAADAAPAGQPEKGFLGFVPDDSPAPGGSGVRIASVRPGAPADIGKLKAGDVITSIDGKQIKTIDDLDVVLNAGLVGQKMRIVVQRNGKLESLDVTLGRRPEETQEENPGEPPITPETTDPTTPDPATSDPATIPPPDTRRTFGEPAPPATTPGRPSLEAPANPASTPLPTDPATPPADASATPSLPFPADPSVLPTRPTPRDPAAPSTDPAGASPRSPIRPRPFDLGNPPTETPAPGTEGAVTPTDPSTDDAADGGGRATLGITVVPLTEEARTTYGLPVRRGALITAVRAGSPAELAGLPLGGVVVSLDGRRIDSADDLVESIRSAAPGQQVEIRYYQGDALRTQTVRLAAADRSALAPRTLPAPDRATDRATPPAGPALRGGQERPLLSRVERALDTFGRTGSSTVYDPSEMAAMRQRVIELTEQVQALEARVKALEGGSPAPSATPASPSPAFPATPAPAPAPAPSLSPALGSFGAPATVAPTLPPPTP